jgi:AcrR family transcriptional regulator
VTEFDDYCYRKYVKHNKDANYTKVSAAVSLILENKGLRALTISAVARESKVSRAWIYKYIGKNQDELLNITISQLTQIFGNLIDRRPPQNQNEWVEYLVSGTIALLENSRKFPSALSLYYKYLGTQNTLGIAMLRAEKKYLTILAKETQSALACSEQESKKFAEYFTMFRIALAHKYCRNKEFQNHSAQAILTTVRQILETSAKQF